MTDKLYQGELLKLAHSLKEHDLTFEPDETIIEDNPFCGDRVKFRVRYLKGKFHEVQSEVRGCLLCQASMAMLQNHFEAFKTNPHLFHTCFEQFKHYIINGTEHEHGSECSILKPEQYLFEPVSAVKSRHECVFLPFKTVSKAFEACEGYG